MKRRAFITLLGGAAATWPLAARAQQPAMPVIGYLNTGFQEQSARLVRAFREGLSETGFVENQNVAIEYRWAGDQDSQLREMADDLVRRKVTAIVATGGSPAALAAKTATPTVPIIFAIGVDPVRVGLVSSLSQPGGNITGATMLGVDLGPKRLQMLRELLPKATVLAALFNPNSPGSKIVLDDLHAVAKDLGLQVHVIYAAGKSDFEPAFSAMGKLRAEGLVIGADPLFNNHSKELAALTVRHAIPAIYQFHEFTAAGGLMSYGGRITDTYRLAGVYTGRILKGEKPADLPVQQAARLELILNLKTAAALGLTVPSALLVAADELIE